MSYTKSIRFKIMLLAVIPLLIVAVAFIAVAMLTSNKLSMWVIIFVASIVVLYPVLSINIVKIVNPIRKLNDQAKQLSLGDVSVDITHTRSDELGQLQESMMNLLAMMRAESDAIESIASGDLSIEYLPVSEHDIVGVSLAKLLEHNNEVFSEIRSASSQVSDVAQQIANGAQALAQGATEQAAEIEQLSATIGNVAKETKESSSMAGSAESLSVSIKDNAERGSVQMSAMINAVREINEASQNIQRVIKVIDDIAFQTNILALNAAVEAARAGQAGKGFAVVAEEVRNLAAKSAAAAADTGSLIGNSMAKAQLGTKIAEETAQSLSEIVSGINENTKIVSDIAKITGRQAAAISQITIGIDQVSRVVQENSAVSEESAASSEEMASQAAILSENAAKFKLVNERKALPGMMY